MENNELHESLESSHEEITQRNYHPTEYEDATWEIVGEPPHAEEFIPTQFEVVSDKQAIVDPMFEDFGGIPTHTSSLRWHLPEGVEFKTAEMLKKEQEPVIPTTALTNEEIEAIKQSAYQEGFQAATAESEEKFKNMDAEYSNKIQEILQDIQKQIEENLHEVEKKTLNLALAISKKIIDGAVEINPEYIIDIINKAISLTGTAEVKTIRVSPQDFEFIDLVGVGKTIEGFQDTWQFVSDPLVKAGCIVETSAGEIDYQLDPAWERVQDQILKIAK